MQSPIPELVTIWTDGSCLRNPGGPGGWAAIIGPVELAGNDPSTTNNRMELTAALRGLEAVPAGSSVDLCTDSTYVADGINTWRHAWRRCSWWGDGGPSAKANLDLWQEVDAACDRHLSVRAYWVRGHSKIPENERADELAGLMARRVVLEAA